MNIHQKSKPVTDDTINIRMIDSPFRPNYALSEDMIATFQKAARGTVARLKVDEEVM